jgi:glycosyltransferase involved in cell wall biosynthesis
MPSKRGARPEQSPPSVSTDGNGPTIGILHSGALLEDWLDPLGVSLDSFEEMTGSWVFGYMSALRLAGVRSVLFCISSRVDAPEHRVHGPTGATICLLPSPAPYRLLRPALDRRSQDPSRTGEGGAAARPRPPRWRRALTSLGRGWVGHLPTPLLLLRREVRRHGCIALLCQDYEYSRFDVCSLSFALLGVPVFATFQGGATEPWVVRPLRRLALRVCSGLIISAEDEANRVRTSYGVPSEKIVRIFDPIDLTAWAPRDRLQARAGLGLPAAARVVAWHGAVDLHYKGLDVLLLAWSEVCRAMPGEDLRLLLVGTGVDSEQLRRRVQAERLRGVVHIDEWVNDRETLAGYLSAADVYAFPSRNDGFAISPIEAMACGLPLVTTDSRGMPDLLEGGEASGGRIVPREDAAAFAEALGSLLDDPQRCRELGARARARVEACFAPEIIGRQLRDFLLSERAG